MTSRLLLSFLVFLTVIVAAEPAFEGTWTVVRRHSGCCDYSATNQCTFFTTGSLLQMASSDAAFEGAVAQTVSGGTCTFKYGQQATLTVTIDGQTLTGSFNDGTHRGSLSGIPHSFQAGTSGASFLGLQGDVKVSRDGGRTWELGKREMSLNKGDIIKTGEGSTAILGWQDLSVFHIRAESQIQFVENTWKDGYRHSKILLVFGNIYVNLKKMLKDGSMEVEMDQAVTSIKGTTFELWENRKGASVLKVIEGLVSFRHKKTGKQLAVAAGQTFTATPTDIVPGNLSKAKTPSAAPKPRERDLFFNGNDSSVGQGAKSPSFWIEVPTTITLLWAYHWNGGQGAPGGGTLSLRDDHGKLYGPWPVTVTNKVYWEAHPDVSLPRGRYLIVDSDPATWAQNPDSRGYGHARVKGY